MKKFIALSFCLPFAASAQMISSEATIQDILGPKWHMGTTFEAGGMHTFASDLSNAGSGDVSVSSGYANLKMQQSYDNAHFFSLDLNYSYNYFDFSDEASKPFSSIHSPKLNFFYSGKVKGRWGAFALANVSFNSASNASMWDGRAFAGGGGVTFSFSESLDVGFGAIGFSRMDKGWMGLPVAFVNWKINDYFTLRTFNGATLTYDVFKDQTLLLSVTGEYVSDYYRLPDENGKRLSVRDSYASFSFNATYNFSKTAFVNAYVGANFDRELQMRRDKRSREKYEVDAAPFVGLSVGLRF